MEQMELWDFAVKLSSFPMDSKIVNGFPHSYRGYYEDLAFDLNELDENGNKNEIVTVKEFIDVVEDCFDKHFEGWKGGEYLMKHDTPIWNAHYGSSGEMIVDLIDIDGVIKVVTKEDNRLY